MKGYTLLFAIATKASRDTNATVFFHGNGQQRMADEQRLVCAQSHAADALCGLDAGRLFGTGPVSAKDLAQVNASGDVSKSSS